jgi:hypothetical protein
MSIAGYGRFILRRFRLLSHNHGAALGTKGVLARSSEDIVAPVQHVVA